MDLNCVSLTGEKHFLRAFPVLVGWNDYFRTLGFCLGITGYR